LNVTATNFKRARPLLLAAAVALAFSLAAIAQPVAEVRVRLGPQAADNKRDEETKPEVEAPEPTPEQAKRIAELIVELGAPRLLARDRAMSELAEFEHVALKQVREGQNHDNDEIAWRCTLLEEVILSGQGELFLAARRLGMSIGDLASRLESGNPTELVAELRRNGQGGFAPVWSRLLQRALSMPQIHLWTDLCRTMEGRQGYAQTLMMVCRRVDKDEFDTVLGWLAWHPPHDAEGALGVLHVLTERADDPAIRSRIRALAARYRGLWSSPEVLAARTEHEEAPIALVYALLPSVEQPVLGLGDLAELSPETALEAYRLLARSGMHAALAAELERLQGNDAPAPTQLAAVAGLYAQAAPVARVFEAIEHQPLTAALAMLDALRIVPREARATQQGLLAILSQPRAELHGAAIRGLSQLRAPGTARGLAEYAASHGDHAALKALAPMADELEAEMLERLESELSGARGDYRVGLREVLALGGDTALHDRLLALWRNGVPSAEGRAFIWVAAHREDTPCGAVAAMLLSAGGHIPSEWRMGLVPAVAAPTGELFNALLRQPDDAAGYELLRAVAADPANPLASLAARAAAYAGQEGELAELWLHAQPPHLESFMYQALALSQTPAGAEYRRRAAAQSAQDERFRSLLPAIMLGRANDIDIAEVMIAAVEADLLWSYEARRDRLPPAARRVMAERIVRATGSVAARLVPENLLWASRQGLDVTRVMFGSGEAREPTNPRQLVTLALLAKPEVAGEILAAATPREDGTDFLWYRLGQAWLGQGNEQRNAYLLRAADDMPHGLYARARGADTGSTRALRELLDRHLLGEFYADSTANVEYRNTRWGRSELATNDAGHAAISEPRVRERTTVQIFQPWLGRAAEGIGADWWQSRRGLLTYDAEAGRHGFEDLE
jgi:hypothetical protein